MQVQVISSANEISASQMVNKTVIVIDVLRTISTIITALAAGAASVTPVETVMEARSLQRAGDLLCGERFCRKITGFDLGNSPFEYEALTVDSRRILLTTTNGTRALLKAMRADYVLAGALLNAGSCARLAHDLRRDVILLCAGAHDQFAAEDGLCAGLMIDRLQSLRQAPVELDDFGLAMLGFYRNNEHSIESAVASSLTGKKLIKLGYKKDVELCTKIDHFNMVPRLNGDSLLLAGGTS
ncbi:2-phosphosulfolactate phosphatase [Paenibacillus protaetiae]|uniref:Probable 2-phosphosulfolactate phosphatase n=1 Tax=Paenibacillus protaetiae TaxID=2509456 RepID=A0A4P6EUB9_9BACL|nr:2-phosphosulfolactate phosphatase [Paenibacillus protaetiae]QAY66256.1 2-phosphosulfolactate phosphatase [Paenibacillus protaetiae]